MEKTKQEKLEKFFAMRTILLISFLIIIFFLTASPVYAQHDFLSNPAGPAFTDTSKTLEMSEEWKARPIKHDVSAGDADIVVTLDQQLYPVLLNLIKKYAKERNIKIVIKEGTCGISAGMMSRKAADIGGYCCPPGMIDRLPGLQYHTLGVGALALLVHPENQIDNITIDEARKIFSGEIYRWSEIKTDNGKNGLKLPIQPVGRLHCKLRPGHWRLLLDNQDLFGTGLQEVGAISDMIATVASNQSAIGYEVLLNLNRYRNRGTVKAIKINGISPYDREQLKSGSYQLYRVYNLTTWQGKNLENHAAQRLVAYLIQHSERFGKEHHIVPASELRKAGWKFSGNELIGGPE